MKKSIEEFLHKSGRHKGSLNQDLLQCDGEFVCREPHPSVDGILFNNSNNGKQIWKKEVTFGKLKGIESTKGVPSEFIHQKSSNGAVKGKLNQDALQIEGSFSKGDNHPLCKLIVFHGFRENGKQRWQTLEKYEVGKERSREYQSIFRKENPELAKQRNQQQYDKNWSDPIWVEKEHKKKREKYADRTPKQIKKDQEYQKRFRELNAEDIKIRKALEYLDNRDVVIQRSTEWTKNNRESRKEIRSNWKKNNREKVNTEQQARRKLYKKKRTKALNQFYRTHDIPEYLWHEDEFAIEPDLQKAIEWAVVSRLGYDIEHEIHLEEQGRPDTYIPMLDLFIEVKLLSTMWVSFKESVKEQAQRYLEISSTVIVSLDGEPDWWADDEISSFVPWMNPEELFVFLAEKKVSYE